MLVTPDAGRRASLIALPQPICNGRMLWFHELSIGGGVTGVLTLGWRFKNEIDVDPWTIRFNAFKFDARDAVVDAASAVCISALKGLHWPRGTIAFTAALPANGTRLEAASRLAVLGRRLANNLGCVWHGDLLSKERHKSLHIHCRIALERHREIYGRYRCIDDPTCDTLFVCDDFVTTGATFTEIARAVHERNPNVRVIGFGLAKTEYRAFAAARGCSLNNYHLPTEWALLWDDRMAPDQAHVAR